MKKPVKKSSSSLGAQPTPSKNMTVSVREIDNGFIVSKSGYKGDKYVSTEMYTDRAPTFDIPKKSIPKGK